MHPGALRLRDQGLTNNPGTDELMVAALKGGVPCVGAAPNYDTDRPGQIRRVFEMAREFDVGKSCRITVTEGHSIPFSGQAPRSIRV